MDALLEHYRNQLGISIEEENRLIEELRGQNPVPQLQLENEQLKKRVEFTEEALLVLMDLGGM